MGLTLALNTALTGLKSNQSALAVLSNNIANANTEGYSRQSLILESRVYNQIGSGVSVEGVSRNVDKFLTRTVISQTSVYQSMFVRHEYQQRIQLQLGQPGTENSLTSKMDNFFTSFQDLADNSDQASLRENAAQSAFALANTASDLAANLEDLRFEADRDIARGINKVNADISALYQLNRSIAENAYYGNSTAELLDKRDELIQSIAEFLNVRVQEFNDGQVHVYTATGLSLVESGQRFQLQYAQANSVESFINKTPSGVITVAPVDNSNRVIGPSEVLVGVSEDGVVNTKLQQGKLRALLDVRDVEIPKYLDTLDEMIYNLRNSVNAIHNQGSGFPPQREVTAQREVNTEDVRRWDGTFSMALVKADGTPLDNAYDTTPPTNVERGGLRPLHLNLNFDSGEGQVGDHSAQTIVDEINAHFGAQRPKVHLNNLNDMRLVARSENNPPTGNMSFDLDLENITDDPAQVQILGVATVPAAAATFTAAGLEVQAGEKMRTGNDLTIDVTGMAAVTTIQVQVQVTNPADGTVETATIEYTYNPFATDIKNDRYWATAVTAGTATIENPIATQPYAVAEFVDAEGNVVAQGEEGFIRVRPLRSDAYIATTDGTSVDLGELSGDPAIEGTNFGLGHYFGFNNFFNENYFTDTDSITNSGFNLSVREDILNDTNLISTGQLSQTLQPAASGLGPYYTFELGIGDGRIAQQIADISLQSVRFEETGLLPVTYQSFSSFSASFIAAGSTEAVFTQQKMEKEEVLLEGFKEKSAAVSGVNIDEEMANTIIYQNAYAASARVITVTNEMFDALIQAT